MAIQVVVAPVLITSCWLINGAWRAPCDDPNLAKTLDSTCFCQIWFASKVGVGLSTFFFLSLSLYTPSTHLVFSFMVWAAPLCMNFHLLSLLLITYPRLSSSTSQMHVRRGRENNAAARYWWRGLLVRVTALLFHWFHGFTSQWVTYLFTMHFLWSMAIRLFLNPQWLLCFFCFHRRRLLSQDMDLSIMN